MAKFQEGKILDVLNKHEIRWSWFDGIVFVNKTSVSKITKDVRNELLKVKGIQQGFDKEGHYIAFGEKVGDISIKKEKLKRVICLRQDAETVGLWMPHTSNI